MLYTVESFILKDSLVCRRLHVKLRVGSSGMVKGIYMDIHTDALDVLRGPCSLKIYKSCGMSEGLQPFPATHSSGGNSMLEGR